MSLSFTQGVYCTFKAFLPAKDNVVPQGAVLAMIIQASVGAPN